MSHPWFATAPDAVCVARTTLEHSLGRSATRGIRVMLAG